MGFPEWLKELVNEKTSTTILNTTKKFSVIYENSNYIYAHFYMGRFQTDIKDEIHIFRKIISSFKFYYIEEVNFLTQTERGIYFNPKKYTYEGPRAVLIKNHNLIILFDEFDIVILTYHFSKEFQCKPLNNNNFEFSEFTSDISINNNSLIINQTKKSTLIKNGDNIPEFWPTQHICFWSNLEGWVDKGPQPLSSLTTSEYNLKVVENKILIYKPLNLTKLNLRKKVESKGPWLKGMLVKVDYNWIDYMQYISKNLNSYANQLYFNLHNLLNLNNRKNLLDLSICEFELLKDLFDLHNFQGRWHSLKVKIIIYNFISNNFTLTINPDFKLKDIHYNAVKKKWVIGKDYYLEDVENASWLTKEEKIKIENIKEV